jgi:transcriptional regulator with XRE-family HTH domain/anti-sigma regulatory factor (Ser/Thr protein kinase)
MASRAGQTQPAPAAGGDHPLRQVRRRRGLTTTALADLSGLSQSFISMVETGQRPLRRRDHVNALAAALRIPPAQIAPSMSPGLDEWAPAPPAPASAFPPLSDDITLARHRALAAQFISCVGHGDTYAAGAWLRRLARDSGVNPWLLLDQLTALGIILPGPRSRPLGRWPLRSFLELGALPSAVPCVRLHTRQLLWEWGLAAPLGDSAELLVSELVTNAVYITQADARNAPVRLWLLAGRARLLLLVWDASPLPPVRVSPTADAENGRGLLLVETLSTRWGHFPHHGVGKVTWALLDMA